jgi:hypothetical protein
MSRHKWYTASGILSNALFVLAFIPGIDIPAACAYGLVEIYGLENSKKRILRSVRMYARIAQIFARLTGRSNKSGNKETITKG